MAVLATIGKILAALLIFGIIVMIHEFGHFIVAKLCRVKVNEFAIGMGPTLLRFGKGETTYSLRLLPIGGFCAMEGEDPETEMPAALGGSGADHEADAAAANDGRAFYQKKVWQRILIVVAGALMNLALGYVLLVVDYAFCQQPDANGDVLFGTTTLYDVVEDSAPAKTGLRAGDEIVSINGKRVFTVDYDMAMALQSDEDGVFDMVVRRQTADGGREKVHLTGVTFDMATTPDGTRYLKYDFYIQGVRRTAWNVFPQALKAECSVGVLVWRSLGDIVTGRYGLNELSGPVGTVDLIGDMVENVVVEENKLAGLSTLLTLVVLITVNVGVFNLLPLPALDGGRLVFLLFEAIFRKKVPAKWEGLVHFIGLILLLLLMLVVTYSDISKLITG